MFAPNYAATLNMLATDPKCSIHFSVREILAVRGIAVSRVLAAFAAVIVH